jgi:cytochrome P450 family 6
MMARFTTDVIASCAFGINGQSLKDADAEFGRYIRNLFDLSLKRGLAFLLAFLAPSLKTFFRLKFVEDETTNYLRQIVWSAVEYR